MASHRARAFITTSIALAALVLAGCAGDDAVDSITSTTAGSPATTAVSTTTPEAPSTTTTTTTTILGPACSGAASAGDEPGQQRTDGCGVAQVWVPPGSFVQGTESLEGLDIPPWAETEARSEQPAHEVEITSGFWMDLHEVTNADFDAFVAAGGYSDPTHWSEGGWSWVGRQGDSLPIDCGGVPDAPRVCVTWYEAEAYASWRGGRLPTEAEWEYAARGPDSSIYPWGDVWDPDLANVVDSKGLVAVGTYPGGASWVGALDMAGNAMEWVSDWMSYKYYASEPSVDPQGPDGGAQKIEKGGWWGSVPYVARSAYRHFEDSPRYQDHHIGLRVVTPVG